MMAPQPQPQPPPQPPPLPGPGAEPRSAAAAQTASGAAPLLCLDHVTRHYTLPRQRLFGPAPRVDAVRGVSLEMRSGTSLGLVGESGSGKSTLARLAMALEPPSAGQVRFLGRDLNALSAAELRWARRDFQMVFQDPYGSLDPRQRVGAIVAEPLAAMAGAASSGAAGSEAPSSGMASSAVDARTQVAEALDAVGLRGADAAKYPHEFSGGQRQRIAIARALITRPRLIVADEPVSALDVSVQAQVLNLLQDLKREFGVTYLFISHDIAVVDHLCDEVAVLYAGRVIEQGPPEVLFKSAAHPYTRALMRAVLAPTPTAAASTAPKHSSASAAMTVTDAGAAAQGCPYAPRCEWRQALCAAEAPPLRAVGPGPLVNRYLVAEPLAAEPLVVDPPAIDPVADPRVGDPLLAGPPVADHHDAGHRAACHFARHVMQAPSPAAPTHSRGST